MSSHLLSFLMVTIRKSHSLFFKYLENTDHNCDTINNRVIHILQEEEE